MTSSDPVIDSDYGGRIAAEINTIMESLFEIGDPDINDAVDALKSDYSLEDPPEEIRCGRARYLKKLKKLCIDLDVG